MVRSIAPLELRDVARVDGPLDGILAEFGIGNVARKKNAVATLLLDGAFRLFGVLVLVEIGNGDVGSFTCVEHSDRAANTRVAAGDERNHAFQLA